MTNCACWPPIPSKRAFFPNRARPIGWPRLTPKFDHVRVSQDNPPIRTGVHQSAAIMKILGRLHSVSATSRNSDCLLKRSLLREGGLFSSSHHHLVFCRNRSRRRRRLRRCRVAQPLQIQAAHTIRLLLERRRAAAWRIRRRSLKRLILISAIQCRLRAALSCLAQSKSMSAHPLSAALFFRRSQWSPSCGNSNPFTPLSSS